MLQSILSLIVLGLALALPLALVVRGVSRRWLVMDSPGVEGQVKAPRRWVPNTGGIVIFWALALPVLAVVWLVMGLDTSPHAEWRSDFSFIPADIEEHAEGLRQQAPLAILVLVGAGVLHVLGLVDDRRPLGPGLKLLIMILPALALPLVPELDNPPSLMASTRLLTVLDGSVGGSWLSISLTAVYIVVLVNAFNFMDNMDGLSAGVAAIAAACFLGVALHTQQWFVAAFLSLLLGALGGFMFFNFPFREWDPAKGKGGATIFLGDGGSLVVGYLLAFLSIRITYVGSGAAAGPPPWHVLLTPIIILAVPLYDFTSVVLIRWSQGKSPFVGDLQHLSHRIEQKGLTRRQAVVVIYLFAASLGLSGVMLPRVGEGVAFILFAQVAASLGALALFEWSHAKRKGTV